MGDSAALIELFDGSLNLIQLPALRLDKGGDRFRGKKRFGPAAASGEGLEPLFRVRVDPDGKYCGHLYWCV